MASGYTRKQPGMRREPDSKEMPRSPRSWEVAKSPPTARGKEVLLNLQDSNYGHNRGAKFERMDGNQAWHASQEKMGDEVGGNAPDMGSLPDPAKV